MDWSYAYTPYIWPMFACAVFAAGLALYAWRRRGVPGATSFAGMMLCVSLWAWFTGIEMAATSEFGKILWHNMEALAGVPAMAFLLHFALEYTSPGRQTARRNGIILAVITLGIVALVATDPLHHLIWSRLWFDEFVRIERGPLNPILFGFTLSFPLIACFLFLRLAVRSSGVYRGQALVLMVANALPVLTFLLEPADINPVAPLDPVLLVFDVSGLLFLIAMWRLGMLNLVPLARDSVIERMPDGLLVLDTENRIVDLNPAAQETLALSPRKTRGRRAPEVLAGYPPLANLVAGADGAQETEISVSKESGKRWFQVQASPLVLPGGYALGHLISLRDITEQKRAHEQLVRQQQTVATLQERERLARELHDCLGQALASARLQAETAKFLLARGETGELADQLANLSQVVQSANADIREYLLGVKAASPAEGRFLDAVRDYISNLQQNYACPIDLEALPEMESQSVDPGVSLQVLRIVQEALTNVRKHADAHRVHITVARAGAELAVTVADNGRGFDPEHVEGSAGYGQRSMRERAESIGGSVEVDSAPGQGTQVRVRVPLEGK